jgi:hypothetical protein
MMRSGHAAIVKDSVILAEGLYNDAESARNKMD